MNECPYEIFGDASLERDGANRKMGETACPVESFRDSKYSRPSLYLQVLHLQIQPTIDQKYSKKKSRKFQKAKLEFAAHWQLFTWHSHCIYNYLHSIYIVLSIISNLEII